MTPDPAPPVVLGPDSTGLARDEAGEPVVVLTSPPEDGLTVLQSPKVSGVVVKVDITETTGRGVYSQIMRAESKHYAAVHRFIDRRARHVAVTADVWETLRGDFEQTDKSSAEMLVRVMSDGRPGTAFIY